MFFRALLYGVLGMGVFVLQVRLDPFAVTDADAYAYAYAAFAYAFANA
jgi:hypothetical protein